MSSDAYTISEAIQRLRSQDPGLERISLRKTRYTNTQYTDEELTELLDCLLIYPNIIVGFYLTNQQLLTDKTGVNVARYLAASSTIQQLDLSDNQFSDMTFLAIAAALRVNTSLKLLFLYNNQAIDRNRIDSAFVDALSINPNRPPDTWWLLYTWWLRSVSWCHNDVDFKRLKKRAQELGHPSMQALLAPKVFGILIE